MHYFERYSPGHSIALIRHMLYFLLFASRIHGIVDRISIEYLLQFRASLDKNHESRLGQLRPFLRTWVVLGLPGIDEEAISVLYSMRLKGNIKGEAVRTADINRGPFTDTEFQAVIRAINDAFASSEISTEDYILIWLFMALGARPVQLATLKVGDFIVTRASDGTPTFLLRVPRAKQLLQKPRAELKNRKLINEIGELIERHCELIRRHWRHLGLPDEALPFFVDPANTEAAPDLIYHCLAEELSGRVKSIFAALHVISERTGKPINVTPYRFRYTRGTRAAAEGASELVIAEILDHSDTQNVGVYVEAVPEIIERIDKATAIHLAPLAQAFAGTLIDDEGQAARAGDPTSRIVTPADFKNPLGSCGSFGFCSAIAPIACYTCRNFQPWLDGLHEEVLQRLLADREKVIDETGDIMIAAINDRLIYACAEVVRLCEARRGSTSK